MAREVSLENLSGPELERRIKRQAELNILLNDKMIEAGRGRETFGETRARAGEGGLTDEFLAGHDKWYALSLEKAKRMNYHGSVKPIRQKYAQPIVPKKVQSAARARRTIKRELRAKGVEIPEEALHDIKALRKLRRENPKPQGFSIYAQGRGERVWYDGKKFTNNALPKVYAIANHAVAEARRLVAKFPVLEKYRVTVEPFKRGKA